MRQSAAIAVVVAVILAGCTSTPKPAQQSKRPKSESAQTLMVRVAKRMQACWFKGKDPAFKKYKMATEINSYAGKPRVLIVPKNKPTGLPKMVVQAERIGGRNVLTSFGPLTQSSNGGRLTSAIRKWERGGTSCA